MTLQLSGSFVVFYGLSYGLLWSFDGQFPTKTSTCVGGAREECDLRDGGTPEELWPSVGPVTKGPTTGRSDATGVI